MMMAMQTIPIFTAVAHEAAERLFLFGDIHLAMLVIVVGHEARPSQILSAGLRYRIWP
jgi:hypothetical protein